MISERLIIVVYILAISGRIHQGGCDEQRVRVSCDVPAPTGLREATCAFPCNMVPGGILARGSRRKACRAVMWLPHRSSASLAGRIRARGGAAPVLLRTCIAPHVACGRGATCDIE